MEETRIPHREVSEEIASESSSGTQPEEGNSTNIQKIVSEAEKHGWSVRTDDLENGHIQFEFFQLTPVGQDFNFSAEMTDDDPQTLVEDIKKYYEGFNVDEEAHLWIGPDGHGIKGAPYHIKDIVSDMEAAEEMVYQLYTALNEIF